MTWRLRPGALSATPPKTCRTDLLRIGFKPKSKAVTQKSGSSLSVMTPRPRPEDAVPGVSAAGDKRQGTRSLPPEAPRAVRPSGWSLRALSTLIMSKRDTSYSAFAGNAKFRTWQ